MEQSVIILNGPSSSGKSTLARALRNLIRKKSGYLYEIVSIDDFLKMSVDEAIYEDDVFEISPALIEAALGALRTGSGVIIDHVITSKRIFDSFVYSAPAHIAWHLIELCIKIICWIGIIFCGMDKSFDICEPVFTLECRNTIPIIQTDSDKIVYGMSVYDDSIFKYTVVVFDFDTIRRVYLHTATSFYSSCYKYIIA